VDAVSIDLHVGEIHAVIGTNGAGKSTLVNMLSGELAPTAGSVRFAGHDVTRWAQPRRARAGPRPQLPAHHHLQRVQRARELPAGGAGAGAATVDLLGARGERRPSLDAAKQALAAAGLAALAARTAGTLSHGAKRQLEIAMCLATAPQRSSSTSRSPAWAARRAGGCWPCSPRSSPGTRSCWSSTTWTRCSASPTGSR
jgi:branched-chain amino acid transport system ATP-binding protein